MPEDEQLPPIEPWFWKLIEQAWSDFELLCNQLRTMDLQRLEQFVAWFVLASQYTRDPWDGPYVSEIGGHLSEDDMQDLNDWIVAQGKRAWVYARSNAADWDEIFRLATTRNSETSRPDFCWHQPDSQNLEDDCVGLRYSAIQIYEERTGADFHEVEQELLEKYDPSL